MDSRGSLGSGEEEDLVVSDRRGARVPISTKLVVAAFALKKSTFELRGGRRRKLLFAELNTVCVDYQKRPCDDHISLSVQSFLLEDPMQSADSEYRQLVAMRSASDRQHTDGARAAKQPPFIKVTYLRLRDLPPAHKVDRFVRDAWHGRG